MWYLTDHLLNLYIGLKIVYGTYVNSNVSNTAYLSVINIQFLSFWSKL